MISHTFFLFVWGCANKATDPTTTPETKIEAKENTKEQLPEAHQENESLLLDKLIRGLVKDSLPLDYYLWEVFYPRSAPVPQAHLYAPLQRQNDAVKNQNKRRDFANDLFSISRKPDNLISLFEANRARLQYLLSKESYTQKFATEVDGLLQVYQYTTAHPGFKKIYQKMATDIEAHNELVRKGEYPYDRLNPYKRSMFAEYFVEGLPVYNEIWTHAFWFRRYQEGNMDAVYRILKDIHMMYGVPIPTSKYVKEGKPEYDAAMDFVKERCCERSQSHSIRTLPDGREIVEVICDSYTYQGQFCYAWRESSEPVKDQFGRDLKFVGNPIFDSTTGDISWEEKARGAGGCGDWFRYSPEKDQYVLREHRSRDCDEAPVIADPQKWDLRQTLSDSHCKKGEETHFSCRTSRKKTVSLCERDGQLSYRFGRIGAPEMVYPKEGEKGDFQYRELEEIRHLEIDVSFANKTYFF